MHFLLGNIKKPVSFPIVSLFHKHTMTAKTTQEISHEDEATRLVSALYNVSFEDQQKEDEEEAEHRTFKVKTRALGLS